jgi:hypothetical protein
MEEATNKAVYGNSMHMKRDFHGKGASDGAYYGGKLLLPDI